MTLRRIAGKIARNVKLIVKDILVNSVAGSDVAVFPLRVAIYRAYGIDTRTMNIRARCLFTGPHVRIGHGTFINYGTWFDGVVEIGSGCEVAMNVLFCGTTHEIGSSDHRAGARLSKPIKVGDGCWIGARAVILPGVTIGDGCVIAAGAVVAKDCAPNGLYAGVPATRIRDLT
jgi:maltose O-acetyltransferase